MSTIDVSLIAEEVPKAKADSKSEEEALYKSLGADPKQQEIDKEKDKRDAALVDAVSEGRNLYKLRSRSAIGIFIIIGLWLVAVMTLVFLGSYQVFWLNGSCDWVTYSWMDQIRALPAGCEVVSKGSLLGLSETIVVALSLRLL